MSEFKREERYAVIKLRDMIKAPLAIQENFKRARRYLQDEMLRGGAPVRAFVVVESDWPEYDLVWRLIEDRVSGRPGLTVSYEHAGRMSAESRCTALQQQLNDHDQKLDEAATEAGKLRANIDALAAQRDVLVERQDALIGGYESAKAFAEEYLTQRDEGLAREAELQKEVARMTSAYQAERGRRTEARAQNDALQQRLAEAEKLLRKVDMRPADNTAEVPHGWWEKRAELLLSLPTTTGCADGEQPS